MIHNACNKAIHDLPDMYALSPWAPGIHISPTGPGPGHTYQANPHAHVTTITCIIYKSIPQSNLSKCEYKRNLKRVFRAELYYLVFFYIYISRLTVVSRMAK